MADKRSTLDKITGTVGKNMLVQALKSELADYVGGKPFQRIQPEARAGLKATGQFIKEHPAETAVGVLSAPILPLSLPGALLAGGLAAGSRTIDKTHPLTDGISDFDTMSARDNFEDIATNALAAVPLHFLGGKLAKYMDSPVALPKPGAGLFGRAKINPIKEEMATGLRYPKQQPDYTLTPLERNQAIVRKLKVKGGKVPPPPVIEDIPEVFVDYVPDLGRHTGFYAGPALPKGMAFRMPAAAFDASKTSGTRPAKLLDQAFLR